MSIPGALPNSPSDAQPTAGWPGLTAYGQGFAVDPAVLDGMAATLLRECDSIRQELGRGSLKQLNDSPEALADPSRVAVFGAWSAGASLHRMHSELHAYVKRFYTDLVSKLESAAQGLTAAADQYRTASDRTEAGAARIDPSAPSTGLPSGALPASASPGAPPVAQSVPAQGAPAGPTAPPQAAPVPAPTAGSTDFENLN